MTRALGLAIVLGGCNAILGLDKTHQQDAEVIEPFDVGLDAQQNQFGTVSVMVSDTNVDHTAKIDLMSAPATDPKIKIGLLSDLVLAPPVSYANGRVDVPVSYGGARPWRLVATFDTVAGPVDHEWQWTIGGTGDGTKFHITAPPVWGHPTGTPPASLAQYAITVPASAPNLSWTELVTGGVWFQQRSGAAKLNGKMLTVNWSSGLTSGAAEPLVGANAAPTASRGDWELILDRTAQPDTNCYKATGGAFLATDLGSGTTSVTPTTWITATTAHPALDIKGAQPQRFQQVHLADFHMARGYATIGQIPGFARRRQLGRDVQQAAEYATDWPVMVSLQSCRNAVEDAMTLLDLGTELTGAMEPVNYVEITDARTIDSVQVVTAVQAFSNTTDVHLFAPLAREVKFDQQAIGTNEALPDFGQTFHLNGDRYIDLVWAAELGTTDPADAWEITLYKIFGFALVPVHVWHTTDSKIAVDTRSVGAVTATASDNHFVFAIRSYTGMPDAKTGDYSVRHMPFSAATFFTTAFVLAP